MNLLKVNKIFVAQFTVHKNENHPVTILQNIEDKEHTITVAFTLNKDKKERNKYCSLPIMFFHMPIKLYREMKCV